MADDSIAALLQEGLQLHRQGAIAQAAVRYSQVLRADPKNVDACYHLARANCDQGLITEGVELLRQLVSIDPAQTRAHRLMGMALSRAGRHEEALASLDRAIALGPPAADLHGSRADALAALGRGEEAVESYDRALALEPNSIPDLCNRGAVLVDLGRKEAAIESFDRVIALAPDFAEAHYNRGNALAQLDRHRDAIADYDKALALNPNYADAHNNRANALDRLGQTPQALAGVEQALAIDPDHHGALITRAILLRKLGRHEEALVCCERVLASRPDNVDALIVQGDVLIDLERYEEALTTLDRVIALKPDAIAAKWNKSLLCLGFGRFKDGWKLYEHRWAGVPGLVPRAYSQPRWDGGRLDGTLLLWGEQGLGDEILFAQMMPDVIKRTSSVVLEVEPRLVTLFARSFPGVKVIAGAPELYAGRVDAQEALGSIGQHFRTTRDAFPRPTPAYLVADPTRARELRTRVGGDRQVLIGLSWMSRAAARGASKSAKLIDFERLFRLPGCRLVDIQYGDTLAERMAAERSLGTGIVHLDDIDNMNDIDGLAALITACDIVVGVSNATAHLAGALGKPTWVLVPYGYGRLWFWFHEGEESPLYPCVHVRRQKRGQPWADLVAPITKEISQFLESR